MTGLGIYLADIAPTIRELCKCSGILMILFGSVGLILSVGMTCEHEPEAGKTLRYTYVFIAVAVAFFCAVCAHAVA